MEQGDGSYVLGLSTLATGRHGRGTLNGFIIAKFGVLGDPDFSRESGKTRQKVEDTHSTSHLCRKQRVVPGQYFCGGRLQFRSPVLWILRRPWDPPGLCAEENPYASFGGRLANAFGTII